METSGTKVCLTALIYLYEGKEAIFYSYEGIVLPLLPTYGGRLVSRTKVLQKVTGEEPDEIHVLVFESVEGFERYKKDPVRLQHSMLHQQSVQKTIVYECDCIYP